MSNVIKKNYIFYNESEKMIINSDSRMGSFVPLSLQRIEHDMPENSELEDSPLTEQSIHPEPEQELEGAYLEAAEEIIGSANENAALILEEAQRQAELIKENAYQEAQKAGYENGMSMAKLEIKQLEQELEEKILEVETNYQMELEQLEPKFAELTIQLVQKITGILVEDKQDIITYLIAAGMRNMKGPKKIVVRVSKEDAFIVNQNKNKFAELLEQDVILDVVEDSSLKTNECFIEAEDRIMDVSLPVQLENLSKDLRLLANS
ncbi:FliH/SctL family protein [Anaeromicropila populeti]|uniref:FliH/SctL family protein n=1 Tax=Anaeromicropila populeti TaxID=37658 RepID=UPI000B86E336|nr:FliH/SctL family protein [Anaeromicropila populeti]